MTRRLNIGCGPYKTGGFINIDCNPRQNPDVVRDVRWGLPYDDCSVDEVRAYHFLEHLPIDDLLNFLEEVYRVLTFGGRLDIIVPLGVTDCLDHHVVFQETSFDILTRVDRDGDASQYFDREFHWREKRWRTFEDTGRQCLQIVLEAIRA